MDCLWSDSAITCRLHACSHIPYIITQEPLSYKVNMDSTRDLYTFFPGFIPISPAVAQFLFPPGGVTALVTTAVSSQGSHACAYGYLCVLSSRWTLTPVEFCPQLHLWPQLTTPRGQVSDRVMVNVINVLQGCKFRRKNSGSYSWVGWVLTYYTRAPWSMPVVFQVTLVTQPVTVR